MNRLCTICGITFDQHECCGAVAADKVEELLADRDRLRAALIRLRDCDWVITAPDRMDAVRDIARDALTEE
jgi:hypothetical protein